MLLRGLRLRTNEVCTDAFEQHQGADASIPKGDLHLLGVAYHFSALMYPPPGTILMHQYKFHSYLIFPLLRGFDRRHLLSCEGHTTTTYVVAIGKGTHPKYT